MSIHVHTVLDPISALYLHFLFTLNAVPSFGNSVNPDQIAS